MHKEEAASDKSLPVYTGLRPMHSICAAVLNSPSGPGHRATGSWRFIQQRHHSVDLLGGGYPGSSCPLCRIMLCLKKGQELNGRSG